jgi:DNA end-binding protein Ku
LQKVDAHRVRRKEYDDAPELTDEQLAAAELYRGDKLIRRGRPPSANPKEAVKLRLDADVLADARASGPGWQTRINAKLRSIMLDAGKRSGVSRKSVTRDNVYRDPDQSAYWKGYLKLSLVSCPIALFPATSEQEKINFHQLHKQTGNRITYRQVDSESGDEVETADIVKGYQVGKGDYLVLDPEELEAIAIESKKTIDIKEFVPRNEIDELYLNCPYYIVPDGKVGQQAFAVIREAIRQKGMVAIGKVVFTSREHIIALEARGKGLLGITLRFPYEVRDEDKFFDDIPDEKVPKEMIELATHIVVTKAGHFDPKKFEDQYEDALKELLKKKRSGQKIEAPREPSNVVNLRDALRRSVKKAGRFAAREKKAG